MTENQVTIPKALPPRLKYISRKNSRRKYRKRTGILRMSILAVVIGIVTGLGAVLFRDLIGFIHNVLFLGQFSVAYNANEFTPPSPWGIFVILIPVLGAIIVTFLVEKFAPEARGHGVPEVMDAVYYNGGIIRPVVALVKSLASAVAIGSGSSVGREGPIIQIGSALGSSLGQIIKLTSADRIILVAAGAGAGIAATFNTPIGGVMFATELMLPEVSVQSFLPVALATGTATFIGQFFFGQAPAFLLPALAPLHVDGTAILSLLLYTLLGAIAGLAATVFIVGLHWAEDLFDLIKHKYLRHILGMLMMGILIYVLQRTTGHYYVEGVGYATVQSILAGQMNLFPILALLFVCKLLATSLSLGSGSSGGIFSPSLFMGATVGSGFAALISMLHLPIPISIPSFAMVGMGAMVGGATGAVMTAVTMIFEMTRDYNIVLPMILAVAMSIGVRQMLSAESIYTFKLFRRGRHLPKALHANMFLVRQAREVMDKNIIIASTTTDLNTFLHKEEYQDRMLHIVVTSKHRIQGVLRINTRNTPVGQTPDHEEAKVLLGDICSKRFTIVRETEPAKNLIRRLWRKNAKMAIVVTAEHFIPRPEDILGVLTKEHVADSVSDSIEIYPK